MYKAILHVVLLFLCIPSICFSQTDTSRETTAKSLKEVEQQIAAEKKQLEDIKLQQGSLATEIKKTQDSLSDILTRQSKVTSVLVSLSREMSKLQSVISKLEVRANRTHSTLKKRIVAIYKLYHRTSALDYLMQSKGVTDLVRRANYLTIVANRDRSLLDRLNVVIGKLEKGRDDILKLQQEKESALVELKGIEIELAAKKAEQESLIEELKTNEVERRKSLVALKAHAVELERALAQLMGGEEDSEAVKLGTKTASKGSKSTDFSGAGLSGLKGKLKLPVQGILVRGFGLVQHEKFEDFLFVKGLEFLASIGSQVKSVAKGTAIYSGELPGYGNVIILDHGARYYTLYGRLEKFSLAVGQTVDAGGVVGVLGKPDEKKRNFYFELRIKGKAVDPAGYFAAKL
jgi:septal ring factor EnvC (AmiA/AmiB activator)